MKTNSTPFTMDRYLMIKTRDELLRINIEHILYFEADRNYTKLLLAEGIQFTFAVNIGKVEEMLAVQISNPDTILIRVGKSHIVNKKHILQINLPKQKLLLLANEGKPRELIIPKEPLRTLKDSLEAEVLGIGKESLDKEVENNES
ncbi:MAG: LytTR family transcriptional regulator [Tannerella sp.]|jgi:DNA-binding LytR/AlgR family response regulator|nr:LytTR family transcriptional regulator [Tannerella sp.]